MGAPSRFLRVPAGVAALALAVAACHRAPPLGSGLKAAQARAETRTPLGAAIAHMPSSAGLATEDFIAKTVGADLYTLKAAEIAEAHARTPQVQAFARTLASDGAAGRAALDEAVASSAPATPIPDAPTDRQQAMLDLLRREPARTFDRTYVEQQSEMEQDTLGQLVAYAQNGGAPGVRAAASALEPQVQAHLDRARALEDSLNTP